MTQQEISEKIIALQDTDIQLRNQLIAAGTLGEGYNSQMEQLHNSNAAALEAMMSVIGFPTVEKVGSKAAYAAWMIIQHAIGKPLFMKHCAALLEDAVAANKADPRNLAYLSDRISVFEDRPQLFGTQFDWDDKGVLNPNPFDEVLKVNARRKAIGLNTLEEQTAIVRQQAERENHQPPSNLIQRRLDMEKWKRKVGWVN